MIEPDFILISVEPLKSARCFSADSPPFFSADARIGLQKTMANPLKKSTSHFFKFSPSTSINGRIAMEEKNLEENIRRNAAGPKSAEIDGQKVEQHSLPDQIAADEYLASKKAIKSRASGLKFTKLSHSGA